MKENLLKLVSVFAVNLLLLVLAWLCISSPGAVQAAGSVVLTTCTPQGLADAMNTLNGTSGGAISFNCNHVNAPATITITQAGGFNVTTNSIYTIDGGNVITLTGGGTTRLFFVSAGVALTLTNITLRDASSPGDDGGAISNFGTLTVINSKFFSNTTGSAWSGGAIMSRGPLNISGSEFAYNSAGNGGAIYPRFAPAVTTITGSKFHDNGTLNTTNGWGGAMLLWDGAPVSIASTNFISNTARQGGAVYVFANSTLTLSRSSLAFNAATAGNGGGLLVAGTALVTGTTIYSNTGGVSTTTGGGGVNIVVGGRVTVNNSNLHHNQANRNGGAILNQGTLAVTNSSVNENYSTSYAAGIHNDHGAVLLNSVVLSGNLGNVAGALSNTGGIITLTNVIASGNVANSYAGGLLNEQGTATLNQVTIDGNTAFDSGGGIYNTGTLRVTDSAISHNQQRFGSTFGGGGLVNLGLGTTILTHVTLDGNTADRQGGGIYTMAADLRLIDVTLSNNTSKFSDGGGLYQFTGTVQIINSTLHHNSAQTDGGGIYVLQGATLLTGTAVSNNAAYEGGGIFNYATTMLNNSTLGGNSASNQGGSIYNVGTTTVNNSTLSGNSAVHGGGIFNDVTLTLTDSTLSDNSASIDGGGIFNNSGAVRLANATLRGNAAQLGGGMINYGNSWLTNVTLDNRTSLTGTAHNLYLASGVLTLTNTLATFEASYGANCFGAGFPKSVSGGHNLANDTSCGLTATGDQQGPLVPILLGPLANHGRPTLTQLPRLGSAAIDNGDNVVCAAPLVNNLDQRGVLRPLDGNGDGIAVCDIGSVERRPTDSDLVPWLYLPLVIR